MDMYRLMVVHWSIFTLSIQLIYCASVYSNNPDTFTNMDILTVVWYFSTFLVLVAFFAVMACSDSHCGRTRKPEIPIMTPPPTPAPSCREFAPPSCDTVMNSLENGIFIISVNVYARSAMCMQGHFWRGIIITILMLLHVRN